MEVSVKFVDYGNDLTFKWAHWFKHAKLAEDASDGDPYHDVASYPACFVSALDSEIAKDTSRVDLDELDKITDDPMSKITILPTEDYTGKYEAEKILVGQVLVDGES